MTEAFAPTDLDDQPAQRFAQMLFEGFVGYHERFVEITRRAPQRFLQRQYVEHQADAAERLNVHKRSVWAVVDEARPMLPEDRSEARAAWIDARRRYVALVADRPYLELAETFYNSVTRRLFEIVGLDVEMEFLWLGPTALPADNKANAEYAVFTAGGSLTEALRGVLGSTPFADGFADLDRDVANVAARIEGQLRDMWDGHVDAIEMLEPVFYRNKGAYLVGRLRWLNRVSPVILPVLADDDGLYVDAVVLTEYAASRMFGYTRSYFHVLCRRPAAVVGFLKSVLPVKPVAELYTSLGYSQHGKTNLFRALYRHMEHSTTRFERARGARGMVMAVFTLPSFDVVFKVIKDRFPSFKRTTPEIVRRRYKLVFGHERVGRLVDAQEFLNLTFKRDRFSEDLLDELRSDCTRMVSVSDDEVVLHHVYTERRLYPLDLYLREMSPDRARRAALDYGNAIKDLAAANIFPGDLFPKNFGVTRHGSVAFYDYDELRLLSDVNFRPMPASRDYDDEMQNEPWFPVDADDVFPEEFSTYLRSPRIVGEVMDEIHPEICTVEFWENMKAEHSSGVLHDFYPYPLELRIPRG